MALVRSWNVFHGNSMPPTRHGHLGEMIELVTRDAPDVVCLQELPVWSLDRLETWSGMRAHAVVMRPPRRPAFASAWLTRLHSGFFRSRLTGQANAILARSTLSESLGSTRVSDAGRECRVVQAVRVGGLGVVANTHLTNAPSTPRVQQEELDRVHAFVQSRARPGEALLVCGDLNLRGPYLPGYAPGGDWIDHILVAGAPAAPQVTWARERRVQNGVVLSDHAPVERLVG